MQIDKVTLTDLSIFGPEEEFSIFHKLNFTQTSGGREWLRRIFSQPLANTAKIRETQQLLQYIGLKGSLWPGDSITNGTLMVIERFYETPVDQIPSVATAFNAYSYKLLHNPDYSLIKYSVTHFADFVRGCKQLVNRFDTEDSPSLLAQQLSRIKNLIKHRTIEKLASIDKEKKFTPSQVIYYSYYLRYHFKNEVFELIDILCRFDAWNAMAVAIKKFELSLPVFTDDTRPSVSAHSLFHILVPDPVAYDVQLDRENNFIFLTGANMAGKSTFIKAVGSAVYLAHIGMGVPAHSMQLSLFDGILSNINVADNIAKGESYFYNEVQRIKNTIQKINDGRRWLVLIDELFKGTNVQDAMKCSSTVIKGLIKISNSLFILSTHLYEIAEDLKAHSNIRFRYFETQVENDQLIFPYQLKEGISNDRLGYLILKREKVIDLLEKL